MVENLNVALNTMKELDTIYKNLDLSEFSLITNPIVNTPSNGYNNVDSRTITVGDTNITINGSGLEDIISQIEELIDDKNEQMLKSIVEGL